MLPNSKHKIDPADKMLNKPIYKNERNITILDKLAFIIMVLFIIYIILKNTGCLQ